MTVANLLTLLRILGVPVFVWLVLSDRPGHASWAIAVFVAAAVTDILDGILARRFGQSTRLGALLDPLADKLLMLSAYLALWHTRIVPSWLLATVLVREALVLVGTAIGLALRIPASGEPTRLGKHATFMQVLTLGLALLYRARGGTQLLEYVHVVMTVAALLIVISAAQYGARFVLGAQKRERPDAGGGVRSP